MATTSTAPVMSDRDQTFCYRAENRRLSEAHATKLATAVTATDREAMEQEYKTDLEQLMARRGFVDPQVPRLFLTMSVDATKDMLDKTCDCKSCFEIFIEEDKEGYKNLLKAIDYVSESIDNHCTQAIALTAIGAYRQIRQTTYWWLGANKNIMEINMDTWGSRSVIDFFPRFVQTIACDKALHEVIDFIDPPSSADVSCDTATRFERGAISNACGVCEECITVTRALPNVRLRDLYDHRNMVGFDWGYESSIVTFRDLAVALSRIRRGPAAGASAGSSDQAV